MKKALITGITGFVGSHLAELLIQQRVQVIGTYRRHHLGDEFTRIEHLLEYQKTKQLVLVESELQSYASIERIIADERPDVIFHLAANSFVPSSWNDPTGTMQNNVQSTLNILQAVKHLKDLSGLKYDPVIQMACSSEEYGLVNSDELPITEKNPLRPLSPYAVSKVTCEMLCWQYARSYGLQTVITRAFNHEGARRGREFVISNFAYQIAQAEKSGSRSMVLRVGNLEARRDFTHVKDVVKAYEILAAALLKKWIQPGEIYNIATGEDHTMSEVVDGLVVQTRMQVDIQQDPDRMRPSDVPVLLGDYSKIKAAVGWTPTLTFKDILRDTLEYWREVI